MKKTNIDNSFFAQNRIKVLKQMQENECLILFSNELFPSNADGLMPFIQNSNFFYLTGIQKPFSALILNTNAQESTETLLIKKADEKSKIWQGDDMNEDKAKSISGIKNIYDISELFPILSNIMNRTSTIYFDKTYNSSLSPHLTLSTDCFILDWKNRYPFHNYKNSAEILSRCRAIKNSTEIDLIKKSCEISGKGFKKVLSAIKPGIFEYELEAEFLYEITKNGAQGFAYEPIIASGINSCVLHYSENNNICKDKDLILLDLGTRYANYNSDFTRVVPINGEFSKRQKQVYNSVLKVLKASEKLLIEQKTVKKVNQSIRMLLVEELQHLGLINKIQKDDFLITNEYLRHSFIHHLGLDTHDNVAIDIPIQKGMVFAIEPAIYIRKEFFGIRLENDYVLNTNNVENLGLEIPIDPINITMN